MDYYPHLNLYIRETVRVCPPALSTLELCKFVANYCSPEKRVLDMGTGTGIIAIYLSKAGCKVTATDINEEALKLAEENSKKNNISLILIHSDLYSAIWDKFHIIIFTTPYFFSKNDYYGFVSYLYHKIVPSHLDRYVSRFFNKIFFMSYNNQKANKDKILEFLKETPKYLNPEGIVFITLLKEDLPLFKQVDGIKVIKKKRLKQFPSAFIIMFKYKK